QKFDLPQMRDALRSISPPTRNEILELSEKVQSFFDIVRRPALLQQVAAIWNDPAFLANSSTINSALIVNLFLESTFRRQSEKVRRDPALRFMRLHQSELSFFTKATAVYMACERLSNQITTAQMYACVGKVWQVIGDSFLFGSRPELGEEITSLKA